MSSKLSVNVNDPDAPIIPDVPDEPADAEPIVIPDTGSNTFLISIILAIMVLVWFYQL